MGSMDHWNRGRTGKRRGPAERQENSYEAAALRQERERREEQAYRDWRRGRLVPCRITQALDMRGLEGPEVDGECGAEEPAVDEWEQGVRYPTWEQLQALAMLTDFPVPYFFRTHKPLKAEDTTFRFAGPGSRHGREPLTEPTPDPVMAFTPEAIDATLNPAETPPEEAPRHGATEQLGLF